MAHPETPALGKCGEEEAEFKARLSHNTVVRGQPGLPETLFQRVRGGKKDNPGLSLTTVKAPVASKEVTAHIGGQTSERA